MNPAKWLLVLLGAVALRVLYGVSIGAYHRWCDYGFLRSCGIRTPRGGRKGMNAKGIGAVGSGADWEERTSVTMAEPH